MLHTEGEAGKEYLVFVISCLLLLAPTRRRSAISLHATRPATQVHER